MRLPCDGPGPAWGHCGNAATLEVRRRDGTRGVGHWCDLHRELWAPFPGHEDDLIFAPMGRREYSNERGGQYRDGGAA